MTDIARINHIGPDAQTDSATVTDDNALSRTVSGAGTHTFTVTLTDDQQVAGVTVHRHPVAPQPVMLTLLHDDIYQPAPRKPGYKAVYEWLAPDGTATLLSRAADPENPQPSEYATTPDGLRVPSLGADGQVRQSYQVTAG